MTDSGIDQQSVQTWLVDKFAMRLEVPAEQIDVNMQFSDFNLASVEALLLAGELEKWLNVEMQPTSMWYFPTIHELSNHIVDDLLSH